MAKSSLKILCATWNVNGKACKEDLTPWLKVPADYGAAPDLITVGLQEEDLRPEAYLHIDENRLNGWRTGIEAVLASTDDYVEVACCQLVGMVILVYCTRQLCAHISDVDTAMVGCGYAGVMGNKGGVGVRFLLGKRGKNEHGRTICFVNSHLNAHAHNVQRRQEDVESDQPLSAVTPPNNLEALKSLIAHDTEDAGPALAPSSEGSAGKASTDGAGYLPLSASQSEDAEVLRPLEHDLVVWLGDLNYRIDLTREQILDAVQKGDWETIHNADQLRREIAAGNVFAGFNEIPPRFWPTYKFDSGTDTYDTSAKQRVPAHCDRVIWRVSGNPSNHRSHRPSSQNATPPLVVGDGTESVSASPLDGRQSAPPPPPLLARSLSSITVLPGTGTAKHINAALAGTAAPAASFGAASVTAATAVSSIHDDDARSRRARSLPNALGSRIRPWRPSDITLAYYRMHMEFRISDHKPVSALLVADLGFVLGERQVDEDTLETPVGRKIARRVNTSGPGRKRNYLVQVVLFVARTSVRSYKFWVGVGLVSLLVYYLWR